MGYFSNGTEGMDYEERWCDRCVHQDPNVLCPIWAVHYLFNYDALKEDHEMARQILGLLIPYKNGRNRKCRMFVKKRIAWRRVICR